MTSKKIRLGTLASVGAIACGSWAAVAVAKPHHHEHESHAQHKSQAQRKHGRKQTRTRSKRKARFATDAQSSFAVMTPVIANGARGLIAATQQGSRLQGHLVVYGLEPGSVHPSHIHGPGGSCQHYIDRHAAEFPTLHANEQGIAEASFDMQVEEQIVGKKGFFVLVHQNPPGPGGHHHHHAPDSNLTAPANPAIGCGNLAVQ